MRNPNCADLSSVHRAANRRIFAQGAVKANARRVSSLPNAKAVGPALASFALTALAIGLVWWWLGASMALPPSRSLGAMFYCVSYAPFRAGQDPLVEGSRVEPWQIEEDLALLSKYSNCVRTYSIDDGAETSLPAPGGTG